MCAVDCVCLCVSLCGCVSVFVVALLLDGMAVCVACVCVVE